MARQRYQQGHILKRGMRQKLWVARWREWAIVGGKPKRKQRSFVLGPCSEMSKSQAKDKLQEILRPVNKGTRAPEQAMTFVQFCARWEEEILQHYRQSTQAFYKATLERWILPYFCGWELGDMKTPDLQAFINQFANYSKSVLKHIRATLSVVMATAVDWQYLQRNPLSGVKLPLGKPVKRAPALTAEQVRLVLANLEEPYRTMGAIMVGSVMRESELLALKWSDFDTENRVIHVRRSLYRGRIEEATKTEKSCRDIPYGQKVGEAVWNLANSTHNRGEYLFLAEHGKVYNPRVVERRGFEALIARLGLPRFTWRSFRRSAATALHQSGTPLKVQQQIMGHATPEMSLMYSEPDIAAQRGAIEQLEALMFPSVPKSGATGQLGQPN